MKGGSPQIAMHRATALVYPWRSRWSTYPKTEHHSATRWIKVKHKGASDISSVPLIISMYIAKYLQNARKGSFNLLLPPWQHRDHDTQHITIWQWIHNVFSDSRKPMHKHVLQAMLHSWVLSSPGHAYPQWIRASQRDRTHGEAADHIHSNFVTEI